VRAEVFETRGVDTLGFGGAIKEKKKEKKKGEENLFVFRGHEWGYLNHIGVEVSNLILMQGTNRGLQGEVKCGVTNCEKDHLGDGLGEDAGLEERTSLWVFRVYVHFLGAAYDDIARGDMPVVAEPELAVNWILAKWKHTTEVVDTAREIYRREKGQVGCSEEEVVVTAWCHDVARARQAYLFGSMNDISTGFFHARESAEMMRQADKLYGLRYSTKVKLAVAEHASLVLWSQKDLCGMLQDADKVANLMHYERLGTFRLDENCLEDGVISNEVMEQFMGEKMVRHPHNSCRVDLQLLQLAWIWGLNFDGAKRLLAESGAVGTMLGEIRQRYEAVVGKGEAMKQIEWKVRKWQERWGYNRIMVMD